MKSATSAPAPYTPEPTFSASAIGWNSSAIFLGWPRPMQDVQEEPGLLPGEVTVVLVSACELQRGETGPVRLPGQSPRPFQRFLDELVGLGHQFLWAPMRMRNR